MEQDLKTSEKLIEKKKNISFYTKLIFENLLDIYQYIIGLKLQNVYHLM